MPSNVLKYYIFKLREDPAPHALLIDTHVLMLGYKLTEQETEMEYALDSFLNSFNCKGHDITNFCIIPRTVFNDVCIYEQIGKKVYLITPTFLCDRNILRQRYPELVHKVYKEDLKDYHYQEKDPEIDSNEIEEIIKDLYGGGTDG